MPWDWREPRDRLFLGFVVYLLMSWVLRTAIVGGASAKAVDQGAVHHFSWAARSYWLTSAQACVAVVSTVVLFLAVLAIVVSAGQCALRWWRKQSRRDVF